MRAWCGVVAGLLAVCAHAGSARADTVGDAIAPACSTDARLQGAADEALAHSEPLRVEAMRASAEEHGVPAPSVRAWVGRGSDEGVAYSLGQWLARQQVRAPLARCATAHDGTRWALVLVPRVVDVDGVQSQVDPGAHARYEVMLPEGTTHPAVVVLDPDGTVVQHTVTDGATEVRFEHPGTYTLQLLGTTDDGPLPLALWHVSAGSATPAASTSTGANAPARTLRFDDPRDVVVSINRLRAAHSLSALRVDPLLNAQAQARAEQLASAGHVRHADRADDSPVSRLVAADVHVARLAENVARARTLADADARLAASPSHLANRIDATLDAVGIGVARTVDNVYVVELFAARPHLGGE